ncbi:class I SAM-dependent methyltransferase [Hyphomicrobium methylovorum]|uniref:class I SAM-dependent methyltransferase n=1 Tax=Hyphomicrobium methylovorum TaxID=84 RepID=UPI0015E6A534|nr:class I SAM-dependent methyltransferase [Hyphomicrobium methylovorum]MBA2127416.1 class I SAM-dependent methyltransferase [Hyphomicrobium methylovorum]
MTATLRVQTFYQLLQPYSARRRRKRISQFINRMGLRPGMRVIDLGGTPKIWELVPTPLDITLLNSGQDPCTVRSNGKSHHKFTYVQGDACDLTAPSNSFDLVFSNSVIEHVGDSGRQEAFATNARRLAPRYWIQTPAKWFPIEAHNGMPLWWFYSEALREKYLRRWKEKMPEWTEMVAGTRVIEKRSLITMFPDAKIFVERSLGIVKSYTVYRI